MLLKKWMDFPDGVSVNGNWIAISNHSSRNILLYERKASLDDTSDPDGILLYIYRPHGVRFTPDGRFLLVADYETPYLHVYERDKWGWHGGRGPTWSLRVIGKEEFSRGPSHGPGAKGVDIDHASKILATTGEIQPLGFFNFASIVQEIRSSQDDIRKNQSDWKLKCELYRQDEFKRVQDDYKGVTNSGSWRLTAPLRWAKSKLSVGPWRSDKSL